MRIFGLSLAIIVSLITLLVLFRRPLLPTTGVECLQLTDGYYNRAMIDLETGKQIGALDNINDAIYTDLSPDHKGVAYVHQMNSNQGGYAYQLIVSPANVVNHKNRFLFTQDDYYSLAFWSPNSRILAYVWEAADRSVYLMLVDRTSGEIGRKKLFVLETTDDVVIFNGWSADSKYLGITNDQTNTVMVISIPDLSIVKTINNVRAMYPYTTAGWSPSSHWLALEDVITNSPMLISPDNNQRIVDLLPDENHPFYWYGQWSPNGEYLAATQMYSDSGDRIDVLGTDGQIKQQITDRTGDLYTNNSSAGAFLFSLQEDRPTDMFGYGGDGGGPPSHVDVYWSADKSTLIFTELPRPDTLGYSLVAYDLKTSQKEIIADDLRTNLTITSDNKYLFYQRRENEKIIVDVLDTATLYRTSLEPYSSALKISNIYGWYNPHNDSLIVWEPHAVLLVHHDEGRVEYDAPVSLSTKIIGIQTDALDFVVLVEPSSDNEKTLLAINIYALDDSNFNDRIVLPQSTAFLFIQAISISADRSLIALAFTDDSTIPKLLIMNRQGEVVKWIERNDLDAVTDLAFSSCD